MIVRPQEIRSIAMLSMTLLLLVLIGCAGVAEPTDPAGYVHYVPRPGSLFQLEFDYPATWYLGGDQDEIMSGELTAMLASARPTPIPTSADGPYSIIEPRNDSEPGIVVLHVEEINPATFTLDQRVQPYVEEMKRLGDFVTLESSRAMQIDGYPAHRVSTVWSPNAGFRMGTAQRKEWVFLLAGNRYYEIGLRTPEHLRNGPFAKGFEHLVSSIRIKR